MRAAPSIIDQFLDTLQASVLVGQVERLEDVREGGIPASDPRDGCFQVEEAFLLDDGGQLSAESVGQRSLVSDQNSSRLLGRLKERDKGIQSGNS